MRTVHQGRWVIVLSAVLLASCATAAPTNVPTASVASPSPVGSAPASVASPSPTATAPPAPTASPAPSASPAPTPHATAPPKPAHTKYKLVKETYSKATFTMTATYRATWTEPDGVATHFTVYGVTDCTRYAKANDGQPCVIAGMQIPSSQLEILATAGGAKRSVLVKWSRDDGIGPDPYWAILISASNQYGESRSAILFSERVCYNCVY
jgi:hypothetical protein